MKRAQIILGVVVFVVTLPWTIPRVQDWAYSGPTKESVGRELTPKLSPGDSPKHIREVLSQLGVQPAFDDLKNRYEGWVPGSKRSVPAPGCFPGSMESVILVYAYLDQDSKFARLEVEEIFTFL